MQRPEDLTNKEAIALALSLGNLAVRIAAEVISQVTAGSRDEVIESLLNEAAKVYKQMTEQERRSLIGAEFLQALEALEEKDGSRINSQDHADLSVSPGAGRG